MPILSFAKRLALSLGVVAFGGLSLLLGAYAFVHGGGNFQQVRGEPVYRSARLDAESLRRRIDQLNVRTVLNLCGEQPAEKWYQDAVAITRERHVNLVDLGLSADAVPSHGQIKRLLEIMREAPKPMIIHCRAGSDRTGLASALLIASHGGTHDQASQQLSLYYGHFPYLGSKTRAMGEALELYFDQASR